MTSIQLIIGFKRFFIANYSSDNIIFLEYLMKFCGSDC